MKYLNFISRLEYFTLWESIDSLDTWTFEYLHIMFFVVIKLNDMIFAAHLN